MSRKLKYLVLLLTLGLVLASTVCTQENKSSTGQPVQLTKQEKDWLASHQEIRIAPDPDFPPTEFIDEKGKYNGIAADYVALLEKKIGIRFKIVHLKNWDECIKRAKSREIDMFGAATKTPQRSQYMLFTKPYLKFPAVIIVRKNVRESLNLEKLGGMKIAVVSEYAAHDYIISNYPNLILDVVPDVQTGLKKVSFGMVDAMVANLATATYYIEKEGITNLRITGKSGYVYRLAFAARKDWPELNRIIEKGLAKISQDEAESIFRKWVRFERESLVAKKEFWFILIVIFGVVVLIISSIVAWNRSLKKQVELRTAELKRELTERKRIEEALNKAEQHYRTIADFTYDWEWWKNRDGTFNYISPSCNRITGYRAEEFIDNPELLEQIILPEDKDAWADHRQEAIEDLKTKELQFRIRKKDGEIRWIEHACQQVSDDQGAFLGFRASNRDITKRKEGEIKLQKAYLEIEQLKEQLEADRTYLGEEIKLMHDYDNIIGESEVLKYVLYSLEQIAPTDTTVLILGESGTGKELIARAIHHNSKRKERPLVKVDCAALPVNLIESELFGHEKGAFTGAVEKRIGRFELADGATLFLDEIGELPVELQTKLLRVLQDGEFERLGSSQVRHTDVRVIAATNRNLAVDISKGRFRADLWYRLNVFPLTIPPLKDRSDDIPLLVNWIIKKIQRRLNKNIKTVPTDIMNDLKAYSWPGNVRELENVIERAVIVTTGSMLQLDAPLKTPETEDSTLHNAPLKSLAEMEKEYILQALRKTNWNISGKYGTAELLGLNSSTLRGRMRKHGIRRTSF